MQYQPLDKVADDIRRTLARQKVSERIDEILKNAERTIGKYRRSFASYQAQVERGADAKQPQPPDFKTLAAQLGLEYGTTPLVNELSVGKTELGQTFTFGPGFQQISFAQIAMQNEQLPPYQTGRINSGADEYLLLAHRSKA